jgi:hypothetical protein
MNLCDGEVRRPAVALANWGDGIFLKRSAFSRYANDEIRFTINSMMVGPPPVLYKVVVRDPDPETLQLIRDFLEPLGYLVECVLGIDGTLSAPDEND